MASKKSVNAEYPYAYVGRETLAQLLDVAPSTVDDLVERGVLPKPYHLSAHVVRWEFQQVQMAIRSMRKDNTSDPYLQGVRNVVKEK